MESPQGLSIMIDLLGRGGVGGICTEGIIHKGDYSQGGLYTGWDIGTALSQHLWLGKLVQNITYSNFKT